MFQFGYIQRRAQDFVPDCQIMSNVRSSTKISSMEKENYTLYIILEYPEQMKIITQLKEIDFQTLIGNIGGYIGLFLGNILLSSSVYLQFI